MSSFEEEYRSLEPVIRRMQEFALFGKNVIAEGLENFPRQGPAIIIGNHMGSYKDVAVLLKIAPRRIYFTANSDIFTRARFNALILTHLKRHMKEFGVLLDAALRPLKAPFVNYISANIGRIGTIPVDLQRKKRLALARCQEYLEMGRAIVLLQGRGRVMPKDPHPFVSEFRRGPAILAYELYSQLNINVPVTPVAMFGTHIPWIVPGKIRIKIGKPLWIRHYTEKKGEDPIARFRRAMEKRVKILFHEIVKSR